MLATVDPQLAARLAAAAALTLGRGLHWSTFRLNVSVFCGIGGALRGCLRVFWGDTGGIRGCLGCVIVSDMAQVELRSGRV